MQREHFLFIPEVSLLLIRDGKIFLLRRQNTGYEDGKYCFIAGHKEKGETVRQAMVREAKEEVDIDVHEHDLTFVHFMHRSIQGYERAAFFFTASFYRGEPRNAELDKCSECGWFLLGHLPEVIPYMRSALDRYRSGQVYSEFGWQEEALSLVS
ncbi:NUDIX domain-containing protein [Candidatus Peregrinibacteria bacterium]|nr:NUDIX domain-containing protein [Candidatus Peregrinibacteria bacterium]